MESAFFIFSQHNVKAQFLPPFNCHHFICFCQLTVNEKVFLFPLFDRGDRCLSAVFALLTCWHVQFSKIFAFPFFLHKLTSISRQNWSCEEIQSLHARSR